MLDATIQRFIARPLDSGGRILARTGVTANAITLLGAGIAVPLIFALATNSYGAALILLGVNRLLDGLDGAAAWPEKTFPLENGDYAYIAGGLPSSAAQMPFAAGDSRMILWGNLRFCPVLSPLSQFATSSARDLHARVVFMRCIEHPDVSGGAIHPLLAAPALPQ